MLIWTGVATAGLALGLLAEALRRRFGTKGAVLTAAASCAAAMALWLPHMDDDHALWLLGTFLFAFYATNLLMPDRRARASGPA